MLTQIISGSGVNQSRSITKMGGTFNKRLFDDSIGFNLQTVKDTLEPEFGSWSNGTGTQVDTVGSLIFDSTVVGVGGLKNVIIANKGTNTIYYGLNNEGIAIASGGFPLATGEAILLDSLLIHKVWALAATSTSVVNVQGTVNYNPNTI